MIRMMNDHEWIKEFPCAITICDADGIIIAMNNKSIEVFGKEGGIKLLSTNILDCHPEPARSKLKELLLSKKKNVYTIEKEGIKKLIYQSPWYRDGKYAGIVELSLEIPSEMPHFIRK